MSLPDIPRKHGLPDPDQGSWRLLYRTEDGSTEEVFGRYRRVGRRVHIYPSPDPRVTVDKDMIVELDPVQHGRYGEWEYRS